MKKFYAAYKVFTAYVQDPRYVTFTKFKRGDLIAFNNRRVLHSRTTFESEGARHLQVRNTPSFIDFQGCYIAWDDFLSTWRKLHSRKHKLATEDSKEGGE